MLNSHWNRELKKPELEQQSVHRAALRQHERAGTGTAAAFQTAPSASQPHEQAPSPRREPDPSRGHLRLHLLLPPRRGAVLERPNTQRPKGARVMGAARRGEAEPLLRLPGRGGESFHLDRCFRKYQKLEILDIIFEQG